MPSAVVLQALEDRFASEELPLAAPLGLEHVLAGAGLPRSGLLALGYGFAGEDLPLPAPVALDGRPVSR